MSHYSDSYEYDRDVYRKKRIKEFDKFIDNLEKLDFHPYDIPERFKNNIEDLINWLKVNKDK